MNDIRCFVKNSSTSLISSRVANTVVDQLLYEALFTWNSLAPSLHYTVSFVFCTYRKLQQHWPILNNNWPRSWWRWVRIRLDRRTKKIAVSPCMVDTSFHENSRLAPTGLHTRKTSAYNCEYFN